MPKWLWVLILALLAAFLWLMLRPKDYSDRRAEADSLRTAHAESLLVWTRRLADLTDRSAGRDSVFDRDSIAEHIQDSISNLSSQNIAQLRQQLRMLTDVRDSNRVLVAITSEQETRFVAETLRVARLRSQRDSMRADRDDWKRAAGGLLAQLKQDSITIGRLVELVDDRCSYLIAKGPCPKLVVGPGVGVGPDGAHINYVSLTGGIPIRLPFLSGRKAAPSRNTLLAPPRSPAVSAPVLSDLEAVPLMDTLSASSPY